MGSVAVKLICHPQYPVTSVDTIAVEIARLTHDRLWLRYHVEVLPDLLRLPEPGEPNRTDGLWRTTCFEAFVRPKAANRYSEFNFSPSSQWAAYQFQGYRAGMTKVAVDPPRIGLDAGGSHLAQEVECSLPHTLRGGRVEVGLSAVIEEIDGTKSYWALRHPPGPPDFHHPDCFALELPALDTA